MTLAQKARVAITLPFTRPTVTVCSTSTAATSTPTLAQIATQEVSTASLSSASTPDIVWALQLPSLT